MSAPAPRPLAAADLSGNLRQMIAVLQDERQALASLDADGLWDTTNRKETLCDLLAPIEPEALDTEARDLVETARMLNEVNRRVRNLLAANVAARLEALGGTRASYSAGPNAASA